MFGLFGYNGYNSSEESILGESVDTAIDYYADFCAVFMAILSVIISPFYIYVYKTNRERDKNSAVFPIVNHFYKMVKTWLVIFIFFIVFGGIFVTYILFYPDLEASELEKTPFYIGLAVGILGLIFLISFTEVFQLLLSLLAIQKFLIYFDNSKERYVIISKRSLRVLTYFLYLVYIVKNIIRLLFIFALLPALPLGGGLGGTEWKIRKVTDFLTISTNLLIIFTSLLYIPILISINKVSHLRSVQESKPQKYIFMQTMTVLIYKLLYLVPTTTYCFITSRLDYLPLTANLFDVVVFLQLLKFLIYSVTDTICERY